MSDQFDAPASGAKITDYDGQLLLVRPTEHREAIQTAYGPADAVVADVTPLDGDDAGIESSGILVFQKALQGQLRPKIGTGRFVLGRLGRGVAKPGQSAPWVLGEPTEADKQKAREHLNRKDTPPF